MPEKSNLYSNFVNKKHALVILLSICGLGLIVFLLSGAFRLLVNHLKSQGSGSFEKYNLELNLIPESNCSFKNTQFLSATPSSVVFYLEMADYDGISQMLKNIPEYSVLGTALETNVPSIRKALSDEVAFFETDRGAGIGWRVVEPETLKKNFLNPGFFPEPWKPLFINDFVFLTNYPELASLIEKTLKKAEVSLTLVPRFSKEAASLPENGTLLTYLPSKGGTNPTPMAGVIEKLLPKDAEGHVYVLTQYSDHIEIFGGKP